MEKVEDADVIKVVRELNGEMISYLHRNEHIIPDDREELWEFFGDRMEKVSRAIYKNNIRGDRSLRKVLMEFACYIIYCIAIIDKGHF